MKLYTYNDAIIAIADEGEKLHERLQHMGLESIMKVQQNEERKNESERFENKSK